MCRGKSFHYLTSATGSSECFGNEHERKKIADPENTITIIYFEIDTAQFSG